MLETLTIKNIAVIDSAEIRFKNGLNILSGETGAGKSIVIEAIGLILGSRANVELIRSGADEAVVEGLFDIGEIPWMRERLERAGFTGDGGAELLIKRVVHRGGRHRIYVNGELSTLAILQDLCEGLIDLCGQHEHQSLLKATTQLELLDRYGTLQDKTRAFANQFSHVRSLTRERDALRQAEAERTQRTDYLKFQIEELRSAELSPDEDEKRSGRHSTPKTTACSADSAARSPSSARSLSSMLARARCAKAWNARWLRPKRSASRSIVISVPWIWIPNASARYRTACR